MAAEQMTDESLGELRGTVDQMKDELDDQYSFLDANKRFHDIIAWSSGNVLFAYIIESLLGIMDGTQIGVDYPAFRRQAILKAHEEIYAALAARDPGEAEARMREHIEAAQRYVERKYPQLMEQTIPWDQRILG